MAIEFPKQRVGIHQVFYTSVIDIFLDFHQEFPWLVFAPWYFSYVLPKCLASPPYLAVMSILMPDFNPGMWDYAMTYIVLVYCFFYYGMFDKLYGETEAIVEAHKRPNLYEKEETSI